MEIGGIRYPEKANEEVYAPDAIHLFSVLIYKCGNCIWRTMILVYFDKTVIPLLQLACSLAG